MRDVSETLVTPPYPRAGVPSMREVRGVDEADPVPLQFRQQGSNREQRRCSRMADGDRAAALLRDRCGAAKLRFDGIDVRDVVEEDVAGRGRDTRGDGVPCGD